MKKTYISPMTNQILFKSSMLLEGSVSFGLTDSSDERDASEAASRGGSFWDDGND